MSERSFRVRLALITAVAAVWRFGYLLLVKIDDELLLNDSLYYSIQAGRISEGDWFRENLTELPGAEHGPLTLAVPRTVEPPARRPRCVAAGRDDGARCRHGRRDRHRRPAPRRAAGRARRRRRSPPCYPNLWINDSLDHVRVARPAHRRRRPGRGARLRPRAERRAGRRCSACSSGSARSRAARSPCSPSGFAVLAWWRAAGHPRRALMPVLVIGTAVLTMAPWMIYNLARFSEPVLLSTNDGTTLLGANCESDLLRRRRRLGHPLPRPDRGRVVDASVRSHERRDQAVDYAGDHVSRLPVVAAARLGRIVDVYGLDVARRPRPRRGEGGVGGVGGDRDVVGAGAGGGRRVDRARAGMGSAARWWLVVPVVSVLVTAILFYGAHRIRAPGRTGRRPARRGRAARGCGTECRVRTSHRPRVIAMSTQARRAQRRADRAGTRRRRLQRRGRLGVPRRRRHRRRSAPIGRTPSRPCRRRSPAPSTTTAAPSPASSACAGRRSRPRRWSGRPTASTTATAATTARPS